MAECLQRDKNKSTATFSEETTKAKRTQNAIFGMLERTASPEFYNHQKTNHLKYNQKSMKLKKKSTKKIKSKAGPLK